MTVQNHEHQVLTAIERILNSPSIPRSRKLAWSRLRTLARRLLAAETVVPQRGRPKTISRERLFRLAAEGRTNREIASLLGCSADAVAKIRRGDR